MNSKSKSQTNKRFYRNLLSSLVLSGRVITTRARAKRLKSEMEDFLNNISVRKDSLARFRYIKKVLYGGAADKAQMELTGKETVRVFDYKSRLGDGSLQTTVNLDSSNSGDKIVQDSKKKTKGKKR